MADREYRISIGISADVSGATQTREELQKTGQAAEDVARKLNGVPPQGEGDSTPLRETAAAAGAATEKLKELGQEAAKPGVKPVAENAKNVADSLGDVTRAAGGVVGGVQAARGSLEGIGRVLRQVTDESAATERAGSGLIGFFSRLGPAVASFAAGWKVGTWLVDLRESLSEAQRLTEQRTAAMMNAMEAAAQQKVEFTGIEAAAKSAIANLDQVVARIEKVRQAEQARLTAETKGQVADINLRAAVDSASAPSQAEKDAIRARADADIALAEGREKMIRLESDLRAKEEQYQTLVEKKNVAARALAEVETRAKDLADQYNELLKRKIEAGMAAEQAAAEPDVEASRRQAAMAAADAKSSREQGAGADLAGIQSELAASVETMQALQAEIKTARTEQQTKAVELGADGQRALNELKAAVDANTAAQAAARDRLATAQATQGPAEQAAAYSALQKLEEEGRKLQAELNRQTEFMKTGLGEFQKALSVGAEGIKTEAAAQAQRVQEQSDQTKAGLKRSADDVVGASGELTKATASATGTMTAAVGDLGKSVETSMRDMSQRIGTLTTSIASEFQRMQTQLNQVSATATIAADNAAIALSRQNANR